MLEVLRRLPTRIAVRCVRFYQHGISPLLGKNCRFQPSCSQYYILAVEKYGLIRGSLKGCYRILRCHPWSKGGEDLP